MIVQTISPYLLGTERVESREPSAEVRSINAARHHAQVQPRPTNTVYPATWIERIGIG